MPNSHEQTNDQTNSAYDYLLTLLSQTDNQAQLTEIFDMLMTQKEQTELANRLTIFALLQQGLTQREISAQLGVGIATVSRGAKVLGQHDIEALLPHLGKGIGV